MAKEVILVVDDSRQTADFVAKSILPSLGFNAMVAYGGKAGLRMLRESHEHISMMLLDLQMPDLSGLDLLRSASEEGISVPAIMITAYGDEHIVADAFRLGVYDYLKKPVDVDKLSEAMQRALSETRLKREKDKLTRQLQEQVTWLRALSEVGRSITSTLHIGQVLQRILEAGVALTRAEQGFIALSDSGSGRLNLKAVKNVDNRKIEAVNVPIDDSLIKHAFKTGKPLRRVRSDNEGRTKVSTGILAFSLIHVPIAYQGKQLGVLSVNNHIQQRNFSRGDETLLKSLADFAAIAIANARAFEKANQELDERRRVEMALRKANSEIVQLIASLSSILIVLNRDLTVVHWNPSAEKIFNIPGKKAVGNRITHLGIHWEYNPVAKGVEDCQRDGQPKYLDPIRFRRLDGSRGYLGINISPIYENEVKLSGFIFLGNDITERKAMENQLSQAQKLRSIGQLAAGIAHEINTPIQYVNDNTVFIKNSVDDVIKVLDGYDSLLELTRQGKVTPTQIEELERIIAQVDLEYLQQEVPKAIAQSLDGIQRVTEIVGAMKEFSHPGVDEKVPLDINRAIENTLMVARNEWKYVAEIRTELDPALPEVYCLPGLINQAFLNIIVNAAQAIEEDLDNQPESKGVITIRTLAAEHWIEVHISDTGPGIPDSIKANIYEPFFTTKEVGKGTGQGLAIAYNVIEIKHGGKLSFKSRLGKGTTFIIRLPIPPPGLNHSHPVTKPEEAFIK